MAPSWPVRLEVVHEIATCLDGANDRWGRCRLGGGFQTPQAYAGLRDAGRKSAAEIHHGMGPPRFFDRASS